MIYLYQTDGLSITAGSQERRMPMNNYVKIPAPLNRNVQLKVIDGHFVTSHSHTTAFLDFTTMKTRCSEAHGVATLLSMRYSVNTPVDTIVCLDGTAVIGTYLAEELTRSGILSYNAHRTIYVIAPEYVAGGQIIFRENLQIALRNKHVLLLVGAVTTGLTLAAAADSVSLYQASISGAAAIFSTLEEVNGISVAAAFHSADLPQYHYYKQEDCPLCRDKVAVDAIANSYGYSRL